MYHSPRKLSIATLWIYYKQIDPGHSWRNDRGCANLFFSESMFSDPEKRKSLCEEFLAQTGKDNEPMGKNIRLSASILRSLHRDRSQALLCPHQNLFHSVYYSSPDRTLPYKSPQHKYTINYNVLQYKLCNRNTKNLKLLRGDTMGVDWCSLYGNQCGGCSKN